MGKTHHPSSLLSRWTISLIILVSGAAIVSGAVYVGKLPNSDLDQSKVYGWTTPIASSKEIITPEGCKKIVSTLSTEMFIPTRSETEWNSFKSGLPAGVRVEECSVGGSCGWRHESQPSCVSRDLPVSERLDEPPYPCTPAIDGRVQSYRSAESCYHRFGEDPTYVGASSFRCVCPAAPPPVVNGVCGSSNNQTITSYPTTPSEFCISGTKVDTDPTATDGTYNWRCDGSGGGSSPSCSATKSTPPPGGSCEAPTIEAGQCDTYLTSGPNSCNTVLTNLQNQGYTNCVRETQGFGPVCCEPPSGKWIKGSWLGYTWDGQEQYTAKCPRVSGDRFNPSRCLHNYYVCPTSSCRPGDKFVKTQPSWCDSNNTVTIDELKESFECLCQ